MICRGIGMDAGDQGCPRKFWIRRCFYLGKSTLHGEGHRSNTPVTAALRLLGECERNKRPNVRNNLLCEVILGYSLP